MTGKKIQRMMDRVEGILFCSLNAYLTTNRSTNLHRNKCRGVCCFFCQKECSSRCLEKRDGFDGVNECSHLKTTFEKAFKVYWNGKD